MPVAFTKTDKTVIACPKCGTRPKKKDHALATGPVITYYCPNHSDTMTAKGGDEGAARRAWIALVRSVKKWG